MDIEAQLDNKLLESISIIDKIDALNKYCLLRIDEHSSKEYGLRVLQCKEMLEGVDYFQGIAYNKMGLAYHFWGVFDLGQAEKYYHESLAMFEKLDDNIGLMSVLNVGNFILLAKGDYDAAFRNSIRGIRTSEHVPDNSTKGWTNYTMGIMYFDIKDFNNSLIYYKKAYDVFSNISHSYGMARSGSGAGSSYLELEDYDSAYKEIKLSAEKFKEIESASGLSRVYNDLGVLYKRKKEFEKAKDYLYLALEIRREIKNDQALATTLLDLGELFCKEGSHLEAIEMEEEALNLAIKKKAKPKELKAHRILYVSNKMLGNIEKSFEHLEKYTKLKEDVSGSEITQLLKMQESNFASEKAEQEAEIERLKNVELKSAHDVISEKNKEITDSINYAKRIQSAILPSDNLIKDSLGESFVLYLPKDIVAGDFYWLDNAGDTILFAAADCTGHGVPGAMVSVVCNNSLHRAVREYNLSTPASILEKTTDLVIEQFETAEVDSPVSSSSFYEVKDGMDIAICSISGNKLMYSGANNPLWLIRNNEIIEIKPNKQPVGKFDYRKPFVNHELDTVKGDVVYIFSDGYVDQFGGEKGKKFKAKRLKELLISICNDPMPKQKEILHKTFESWRGNIEQIDDVCIIGVRV